MNIIHSPMPDAAKHPCFNAGAKGRYGRVHLPVAPSCTIKCNYCNRKYDCVNESRPGVTSAVLQPFQAADYVEQVLAREPRISVVGIAGPGDPMADAGRTLETLRLIRQRFPELILCLATNGLALPPHVPALAQLGVSHVTVTVNAVDPAVSEHIYAWARDGKVIYRGREAAELLLERQIAGIQALKQHGITVKINTVVIPGYNDGHVEAVAARMAELGADLLNLMAMHPTEGSPFADIREPSKPEIEAMRKMAEGYLPQMRHCTRCRADAVGLLGEDRSGEFGGCLSACASTKAKAQEDRPYVAVATMEGALINLHLGEATSFDIWGQGPKGPYRLETREAPRAGSGRKRWDELSHVLHDCRAVFVSGIGESPRDILAKEGIQAQVMTGVVELALETYFAGGDLSAFAVRRKKGCQAAGGGCG